MTRIQDSEEEADAAPSLGVAQSPPALPSISSSGILALLFSLPMDAPWWRRYPWLWLEGVAATGVAILVPALLDLREAGFFSLFLMAAGLSRRFRAVLDENRHHIYQDRIGWRSANSISALSVLALFLGIGTTYLAAAVILGSDGAGDFFGFALDAAGLGGNDNLFRRRFGSIGGIASHNLSVAAVVFLLCALYRGYGALLALGWNACVWAVVIAALVQRVPVVEGMPAGGFLALAATALMPHLLLESLAYVLVALAGIFLSRGLLRHGLGDSVMSEVAIASLKLMAVAVVLLLIAAVAEAILAPALLDLLD